MLCERGGVISITISRIYFDEVASYCLKKFTSLPLLRRKCRVCEKGAGKLCYGSKLKESLGPRSSCELMMEICALMQPKEEQESRGCRRGMTEFRVR